MLTSDLDPHPILITKNKVLYEIHWSVRKKKNKLKNAMLLYLASELRLFKQSAVIGSNFKVKAYKKRGRGKTYYLSFILIMDFSLYLYYIVFHFRDVLI